MDEVTKSRLFDPLFTTKTNGNNAGLGLANVSAFVQQCCGDLSVLSSPGSGTTFLIRLPLMAQKAGRSERSVENTQTPSNLVILVIDDNENVRNTIADQLTERGHNILLASSTAEADLHIRNEQGPLPQLVICDFDLGEAETGADFARRLQRDGFRIPGILISGYFDISTDGAAATGWKLLRKPYTNTALNEMIRSLGERNG
jgi:CheY-like chemotaxis protein